MKQSTHTSLRQERGATNKQGVFMNHAYVRGFMAMACAAAVTGCSTMETTQPGTVGVDRRQSFLVSEQALEQAASEEYAKMLSAARSKGTLDCNAGHTQRVRSIANRLTPQTRAFRADAPAWKWEAHVICENQLNAWAMPGGKMVVYSGLIEQLKLTDDELAAIMGHEMAHALREHSREAVSREMGTNLAIGVASAALGLGQTGSEIAGALANVTFSLPHSRTAETEADRIGVELAARAGYNPRGAVSLWQKMGQASAGGPPQFLSTHPSAGNRLADLEVYAQRVMPLYQAAHK
jgi:predicted Zn-dependent protease